MSAISRASVRLAQRHPPIVRQRELRAIVCQPDGASDTVGETLKALRESPATAKAKAKFVLATDGQTLEAEELISGETIADFYAITRGMADYLIARSGDERILARIATLIVERHDPTAWLDALYADGTLPVSADGIDADFAAWSAAQAGNDDS